MDSTRSRAGAQQVSLLGRSAERATVEQVLAGAKKGRSGVLVVGGEAGIGKTALLEHTRDTATTTGFRVEWTGGVESETEFAFAGLHQLCAPLLDRLEALPDPQQTALGVAFGLRDGAAPDRFLVALATLNLLAEVAEDRPLLCLVDDAQWLDQTSAQVMAFVARRLYAERIALIFGLRDFSEGELKTFAGLPEVRLDGLGETDARMLLAATVGAPLDDEVRDRIVAEARGNPLALLELPRSAQPAQMAGGFELPDVLSVPRRIEDSFQRRSASLPADTQMLLLVAAAEPTGDVALLWRAAAHLGIAREASGPAEDAELVEVDTRVRFRHPLVRSAVYAAATPPDQRRAHSALAAVTDPQLDPDRRAWHRAQAVLGTDEEAAAELEDTAGRARSRGGLAAAAAFMEQAAMLTPEPARRATRALQAAHARHDAGAPEAAMSMLDVAEAGPLDNLQLARIELLRAQIAFHLTRGSDVPGMLLGAAKTLAPLDAALARETYLHALDATIITGGRSQGGSVLEVAEAARAAPAPRGTPRPADMLLDGLVMSYTTRYEDGVPALRQALATVSADDPPAEAAGDGDTRRWTWLASRIALALFDDALALELVGRNARHAREAGALAKLPSALLFHSAVLVLAGELGHAGELAAEGTAITRATGAVPLRHADLVLAGWQGRQNETVELSTASVQTRGTGTEAVIAQYALAVLHNGLGNYPAALDAAEQAFESDELLYSSMTLPELVEAASRADQPERANLAVEKLSSRAKATRTQWALGLAARSRALVSTGPAAERHYQEAIERLGDCRMAGHLARTHLVYGEWLRREGRRQDARVQLRTAHKLLSDMGAEAFAERAANELRATGENPRKRSVQPSATLTEHEMYIARLVATGATNKEIGAQLFLSPRTIEAHLRSIFRKLDITSRRQIKDQLPR